MECQKIGEEDDLISLINWDDLLDFAPPLAESPSGSVSPWIGEVENLLLRDDGDGVELVPDSQIPDEFFRDIFVDSPSSSAEVIGNSAGGNPLDVSVERSGNGCPLELRGDITVRETEPDGLAEKVSDPAISVTDGSDGRLEKLPEIDDGPVSKKRKRQLRNRDAAVKSRERKKLYVKDLETKSRYMERECLRLGRLLQCFIAENQVLRLSLQNGSAFDVSSAKQESAVLLLGIIQKPHYHFLHFSTFYVILLEYESYICDESALQIEY